MIEKFDRLEEGGSTDTENFGNILVAITQIREQMAAKKVVTDDYQLDDFAADSYLPFMNYLQNREYGTVRRFLLIHPKRASSRWEVAGNGVHSHLT